jgi:hypothetical protein
VHVYIHVVIYMLYMYIYVYVYTYITLWCTQSWLSHPSLIPFMFLISMIKCYVHHIMVYSSYTLGVLNKHNYWQLTIWVIMYRYEFYPNFVSYHTDILYSNITTCICWVWWCMVIYDGDLVIPMIITMSDDNE